MTLRTRLWLMWCFAALVCAALALIVRDVYSIGTDAQIARSRELATAACESIAAEYAQSTAATEAAASNLRDLMHAVLELVLREASGVEGGFWERQGGFVAYAYPTHEGSDVKKDPPETERAPISALAAESLDQRGQKTRLWNGRRETIVQIACPVAKAGSESVAWTMARVPIAAGQAYDRVWIGLMLLLGFVVSTGAWLMWSLSRWTGQLSAIERALAAQQADAPRPLAPTSDTELDRIVRSINDYIERLEAEKARSVALTNSLAASERLAALGRVAAGVAHEIRNPLATMRLKIENALAAREAGAPDHGAALHVVLAQVTKLDMLVRSLLLATKPLSLEPRDVDVRGWLEEHVEAMRGSAEAKGVAIAAECAVSEARFDPAHLGRALDNLLDNALAHNPTKGTVKVSVAREIDRLVLRVADSGPGVAQDIAARLFEPFATGRPDGTGLGLTIVREIARAHGGEARLMPSETGAVFEIEVPWRRS